MLYYGNIVTFQYVGYESVRRPGKTKKIKKKNKERKKKKEKKKNKRKFRKAQAQLSIV